MSNVSLRGFKVESVMREIWEDLVYEQYRQVQEGDIVVDVGAMFGSFTVKAAFNAYEVYAFEPESENFKHLSWNVLNWENVKTYKKAVWSSSGNRLLYLAMNEGGHSLLPLSTGKSVMVETVTLDEVVDHADFLKIDVEGAEVEVLRGAEKLISRCKPFVAVEIHNPQLHKETVGFLSKYGYVQNEVTPNKYGVFSFK